MKAELAVEARLAHIPALFTWKGRRGCVADVVGEEADWKGRSRLHVAGCSLLHGGYPIVR